MKNYDLTPITEEQAITLGLPKWPQMLVTGDRVTSEQADDIILNTDVSIGRMDFCGNDKRLNTMLNGLFGFNELDEYTKDMQCKAE